MKIFILSLLCFSTCFASELYFNNGKNLKGEILEANATHALIKRSSDLQLFRIAIDSLTQDNQALQRLTEAAEKAKIELSTLTQSSINLPFISVTPEGPKHLEKDLTRVKFEELCATLIDRCKTPIQASLKDAELNSDAIDQNVFC